LVNRYQSIVTNESGVQADPAFLALLPALEARLPVLERHELAEAMAPVVARLQEPIPAGQRAAVAEAVMGLCRRLFAGARSGDALPLARALLAQSLLADDPVLERRASGVCGLLAADTADVVGAIGYHARALQLAEAGGNPVDRCTIWNNIGLAFRMAGNTERAVQCYRRALAKVDGLPGDIHVRYTVCSNLSGGLYHLGDIVAGLRFARQALAEALPAWVEQDPHSAILLRRNLVRLLIAAGELAQAREHVDEVAVLAARTTSPRTLIAAATTRATYELATGSMDIALTRLEDALARARSVPAALRDTLGSLVRAEEAAGRPERALVRLQELSDHFYRFAVDRARDHVELSLFLDAPGRASDPMVEQARARLVSHLRAPGEPEEWKAYQRLGVAAALRMDATGWHGLRVGALAKALAMASGIAPLQALEMGLAAELHDIGLSSVPEAIVAKRGELNAAERALVERHTDAGAEILSDDGHPRLLMAREIAKYHHARYDGAGYPERVGGKFIPLAARICAVADAYDVMVCGLENRPPMSMSDALAELRREAGGQFDPALVDRFEAVIRDETADLGVDPAAVTGLESFQDLVMTLQEDRGFV
jgi:putative two-component system response regulator